MELINREGLARGAAAMAIWAIAMAQGLGSVLDSGMSLGLEVLAAVCFAVAMVSWGTEDRVPWRARAVDIGGAALLLGALAVGWLVSQEQVVTFLDRWLVPTSVFLFAVGVLARYGALDRDEIGSWWLLGLAGLLLLVGMANLWAVDAQNWSFMAWSAAEAAALIGAFIRIQWEETEKAVSSRTFQYGSGSILLVALATALAVGSFLLAERNDYTWDLTRGKAFSLSDQSKLVVDGINFDVKITAFFRSTAPGRLEFEDLIERFLERNHKLTIEWVDPLQQPRRAQEADIVGDHGTILLEGNGRTRRMEWEASESDIVRELVLLASNEDHHLCWSLGHGEPHPDDEFSEDGLGAVRLELEKLNYEVAITEVAKTGIPRECAALIIARPTTEWLPYEREALAAYLAEGGRVLLLLDAGDVPELADSLERYGVLVGDDVVVDLNLKNQMLGVDDPSFVVLSAEDFGDHPITRSLGAALVMPVTRSVRASKEPREGLRATDLLRTSPEAWGETDPGGASVQPDAGLEVVGEVPVMTVVEVDDPAAIRVVTKASVPPPDPTAIPVPGAPDLAEIARGVPDDFAPKKGGRLVVIGDSDFAANRFLGLGNNRDLFLNSVAWLVDEENQLGERPEQGDVLEISAAAQALLCIFSIFVVPGTALLAALVTLIRRRRL